MLKPFLIPFVLPLLFLFSNGSDNTVAPLKNTNNGSVNSVARVKQNSSQSLESQTGTLEKLMVAQGRAAMDIDLNRLNGIESPSQMNSLRFTVAPNSFFTILVFNKVLRGPDLGSMALIPQSSASLPAALNASLDQLVIEKAGWTEPFDLLVRDGKTGFTFFNIEGNLYEYAAKTQVLSIKEGRLLLSEEFAAQLGRKAEAGSVVGTISVTATMRQIEIKHVVNGETTSAELPAPLGAGVPGPDVIVGVLPAVQQFGSSGTQVGLAVATDSCNAGAEPLHWFALPSNDHPVIPQNLYRMSGGATNDERFEQVGQSWLKHAFTALQQDACGFGCQSSGTGTLLGAGCSDPYSASLNASQTGLGSRAFVNPFTGAYPGGTGAGGPRDHTGHSHSGTSHRMVVETSDLNPTLNPGAIYYAEAQYVTPHEYAWCQANPGQCNMYNNTSHRRFNVSGTTNFSFSPVGSTVQTKPAVTSWPGATANSLEPAPGVDGVAIVSYKVTNPSPGVWHYEYAVYNENLDRAIQSFSIPLAPGTNISNLGFHAPPQPAAFANDGTVGSAGYSSTPWTPTQTADSLTWSSQTFAQNQNANAIRWGTLYNFRFDSDRPPQNTNATVGYFKTGSPSSVPIQGPSGGGPTPTPTPTPTPGTNVALAANGGVASASSTHSAGYSVVGVNNGERSGANWGNGSAGWNDGTANLYPDTVEVVFSGAPTINEIDVFSVQDNYLSPVTPTEAMTFTLYGLTAFDVQYWDGGGWVTVTGGSITGNNKVWRKLTFAPVTTTKIRIVINDAADHLWSRMTEIEAYTEGGVPTPTPTPTPTPSPGTNVALAANGGVASASSTHSAGYSVVGVNNGERSGANWGNGNAGWNDGTANIYPDTVEVVFSGAPTINEIDVFSVQDNYLSPVTPTEAMTFTLYGLTAFDVQYWDGGGWVTVTGGSITGNNKVWRKLTFAPVTTTKIRIVINDAADHLWSRITEIEAYTEGGGPTPTPTPTPTPGTNVALAANGGVASASSTHSAGYSVVGVNNGERSGANWGNGNAGWNDGTANLYPDTVEVTFNGSQTINEIDVFSVQDNYLSPVTPTEAMTFTLYGLTVFDVQYLDGVNWVTVTGGNVSGNNKVWRKLTFAPVTTPKIRIVINDAADHMWSRITEIEAYTVGGAPPPAFNAVSVASGISNPTAMAFAPDGRLFVCQQSGQLRVIENGALLPTPFTSLTVNSSGERGLLGVAFDPNFTTNQFVYVYYTATTPTIHNRVSRFTANGNVALAGSEVPILDLNNLSATNHNGGAIHFGPDGLLYIAVGENANAANSQSVGNLLGKILRINSNGTIPSDNPTSFPGIAASPSGVNRAIWSVGLRNPYTFDFQPGSGRMFINDVGEVSWEEINDGIVGSNYGWSNCEGACAPPNANFRDPLFQYGHGIGASTGCAITGGVFYNPGVATYPSEFVGKYFYAEFCSGWIRRFDPATSTSQPFRSGLSSPVDLKVGPEGNLYYLVRGGGGAVFKIVYS